MTSKSKAAYTLYHNPRCTKSRAVLGLLEEHGVEPVVIEYLKTPPSATELKALLVKLKFKPIDLVRKGEDEYRSHVEGKNLSDSELIAQMVKHPVLIERPILVRDGRAAIGRPPENVLTLLK